MITPENHLHPIDTHTQSGKLRQKIMLPSGKSGFKTLFIKVREEIVELVPIQRVAYRLLSGLPLSNYLAKTDLHPLPSGGTRITWQATFDVNSDSTAWFWRLFMRAVLTDFTRRLAKASETLHPMVGDA